MTDKERRKETGIARENERRREERTIYQRERGGRERERERERGRRKLIATLVCNPSSTPPPPVVVCAWEKYTSWK